MTTLDEKVVPDLNLDTEVAAELEKLRKEGKLDVTVIEPKCWICQDEPTRNLVNGLLARLFSYRDIESFLDGSVNQMRRAQGQKPITRRRITTHARQHFNVQAPAWAAYRSIGERRARQMGKEVEEAVGGFVTHLAFLETVQQKAYEAMVHSRIPVSVSDGINASKTLAEIERRTAEHQEAAEMVAQVNRIIAAIKATVPEDLFQTIVARARGEEVPVPVRAAIGRSDDDDDEFDPGDDEDFDNDD